MLEVKERESKIFHTASHFQNLISCFHFLSYIFCFHIIIVSKHKMVGLMAKTQQHALLSILQFTLNTWDNLKYKLHNLLFHSVFISITVNIIIVNARGKNPSGMTLYACLVSLMLGLEEGDVFTGTLIAHHTPPCREGFCSGIEEREESGNTIDGCCWPIRFETCPVNKNKLKKNCGSSSITH